MTDALEASRRVRREAARQPLRLAVDQNNPISVRAPQPEATALLSRVLAQLQGIEIPVVQFVQVSGNNVTSGVARSFADASLAWLGRTLLVSLRDRSNAVPPPESDRDAAPVAARRRLRKPIADQANIVPDLEVPELYHARLGPAVTETISTSRVQPAIWLGEARADFRVLIIDCGCFDGNPAAVELAPRCHGSILTVAASQTTLPEIVAASKQLQLAGGRLFGTVLYNAQTKYQPRSIGERCRVLPTTGGRVNG